MWVVIVGTTADSCGFWPGGLLLGRRTSVRRSTDFVSKDTILLNAHSFEKRVLCLKVGKESSERKYVGDAWAHRGDEGRGKLR
jgi:hypothetical protein